MCSRSRVSRRRKEYLGRQREAALSRLQSHLIWIPMMPPCGESRRDTGRLSGLRPMLGLRSYVQSHAGTYLNCHVLEAVACILHDFAKTEYGAEGICLSIINA